MLTHFWIRVYRQKTMLCCGLAKCSKKIYASCILTVTRHSRSSRRSRSKDREKARDKGVRETSAREVSIGFGRYIQSHLIRRAKVRYIKKRTVSVKRNPVRLGFWGVSQDQEILFSSKKEEKRTVKP